jgi:hypothetical protein
MPDHNSPLDPNTMPRMRVETFAEFAIESALWLVRESWMRSPTRPTSIPIRKNCFRVLGRLPAILQLEEPTEEQGHDMFVEGFRPIPNGAQETFELLLSRHKEMLWEGFRQRWSLVVDEIPLA